LLLLYKRRGQTGQEGSGFSLAKARPHSGLELQEGDVKASKNVVCYRVSDLIFIEERCYREPTTKREVATRT
jgi:hypothetical protein